MHHGKETNVSAQNRISETLHPIFSSERKSNDIYIFFFKAGTRWLLNLTFLASCRYSVPSEKPSLSAGIMMKAYNTTHPDLASEVQKNNSVLISTSVSDDIQKNRESRV